jgi:hypothetical protein
MSIRSPVVLSAGRSRDVYRPDDVGHSVRAYLSELPNRPLVSNKAAPAAPLARRQRPGLRFAEARPGARRATTAEHTDPGGSQQAARWGAHPSPSLPIVQLAATASRHPRGLGCQRRRGIACRGWARRWSRRRGCGFSGSRAGCRRAGWPVAAARRRGRFCGPGAGRSRRGRRVRW